MKTTSFSLEIKEISAADALAKMAAMAKSDYFGPYSLESSELATDSMRIESRSWGLPEKNLILADLRGTIQDFDRYAKHSKSECARARLSLIVPEEIKKRLGLEEKRDSECDYQPVLSIWILRGENAHTFQLRDLGLKRSFYESNEQMTLYRKDSRFLKELHDEIEAKAREVLPHQNGLVRTL